MKAIKNLKRGDTFWFMCMLYKVVTKFDNSVGYMRAKCIASGDIERFENPEAEFSTTAC